MPKKKKIVYKKGEERVSAGIPSHKYEKEIYRLKDLVSLMRLGQEEFKEIEDSLLDKINLLEHSK